MIAFVGALGNEVVVTDDGTIVTDPAVVAEQHGAPSLVPWTLLGYGAVVVGILWWLDRSQARKLRRSRR